MLTFSKPLLLAKIKRKYNKNLNCLLIYMLPVYDWSNLSYIRIRNTIHNIFNIINLEKNDGKI